MVERFVYNGGRKMNKQIKELIIFGGGTSGWLTAAYLVKNLQSPCKITLIEDVSAGPIGVGEGTQPLTAKFLFECGIDPKRWMKPSNAAFKYGVELTGWNDIPYFVDNDTPTNYMASQIDFINRYFHNQPYEEYAKWHPAYRLAKKNVSPKLETNLDVSFGIGPEGFGAVHFSAYDIIDTLKKIVGPKIIHVDAKIVQAKTNSEGISDLIDDKGNTYTADLFLDCSGFKSALLGKGVKSEFVSYKEQGWLLNDSAVAMPTQYTNPQEECHPYTKATTMTSGWRWTIPTYKRIGNGYVYSSDFLSEEEAEKELRESVNDFETPVKHLKMRCGSHKEVAKKNVVGIGLAAGFIEPLEATGITFTTSLAKSVTDLLNLNGMNWDDKVRDFINQGFYEMSTEILAFVWSHYHFSKKDDTPYWKAIREQKLTDLPSDAQHIISQYWPKPKPFLFFSQQSMFTSIQWWSMIHAGGGYNTSISLSEKEKDYFEYFIKNTNNRIEMAEELFPNHYEFLKEWYDEWKIS